MTTETTETPRNGSITAGLTTGIIGTALGALNTLGGGAALLNGGIGAGAKQVQPQFVSREEFEANMKIANKDSEIALLKSERDDEKKMVEVYAKLEERINSVKDTMAANRDRADDRLASAVEKINCKIDFNKNVQDGINAQQLAYNGTNSATLACMQNQVAQLYSMTKLVIPNANLCPGVPQVQLSFPTLSA